jgi:ATP-dependent protease ClpP protease subunit
MQLQELLARAERLRAKTPTRKRADWYDFKTEGTDTAEVYIYDEIGYFGTNSRDFVRDLAELDGRDLTVHLNSPGGEVFEGLAIYNALRKRKGNCSVAVDSLAASIASVIAMAGTDVQIAPAGMLMIHDAWGVCVGNEQDMIETGELLGKASDIISGVYQARGGGTREDWRARMRTETWYAADEAVKAGLADSVASYDGDADEKAKAKAAASFDLSVFNYAGRSKAPPPSVGLTLDPAEFSTLLKEAFK